MLPFQAHPQQPSSCKFKRNTRNIKFQSSTVFSLIQKIYRSLAWLTGKKNSTVEILWRNILHDESCFFHFCHKLQRQIMVIRYIINNIVFRKS
jgi:hypothetical protein